MGKKMSDPDVKRNSHDRLRVPFGSIDQSDLYEDGALRDMVNIRWQDGVLRPVPANKVVSNWNIDTDVKHLTWHRVGGCHHLLYTSGDKLFAIASDDLLSLPEIIEAESLILIGNTSGKTINGIAVNGNIVSVVCDDTIFYAQLKNCKYIWLGEFPEIPVFQFEDYRIGSKEIKIENPDELKGDELLELVNTEINKAKIEVEDKMSSAVFFGVHMIRYAFRLFDGTLVQHSAPIIIIPRIKENNTATGEDTTTTNRNHYLRSADNYSRYGRTSGRTSRTPGDSYYDPTSQTIKLKWHSYAVSCLITKEELEFLNKWRDVIKSIDFFITDRLYESSAVRVNKSSYLYRFMTNVHTYEPEKVSITAEFYLLNSVDISEIKVTNKNQFWFPNAHSTIEKENDIVVNEVMSNSAYSHNRVGGKNVFTFNNRLRISDVETKLYQGYGWEMFLNPSIDVIDGRKSFLFDRDKRYSIIIDTKLNINAETRVVTRELSFDGNGAPVLNSIISYPDPRATEMRIRIYNDIDELIYDYNFFLKAHDQLDLAYFMAVDSKGFFSPTGVNSFTVDADGNVTGVNSGKTTLRGGNL